MLTTELHTVGASTSLTKAVACPTGTFLRGGGWNHQRAGTGVHAAAVHAYANGPKYVGGGTSPPSTTTWVFGIRNDDGYDVYVALWIACGK